MKTGIKISYMQLKIISNKEKKQLDATKDWGGKQLDAIEREKGSKLKTIEKDKIVYLREKIDELFEIYPKSFEKKVKLC